MRSNRLRLGWVGGGALVVVALLAVACGSSASPVDSCVAFIAKLYQCEGQAPGDTSFCTKFAPDAEVVGCGGEFAAHYECLAGPDVDVCSNVIAAVCSDEALRHCFEVNCPLHQGSSNCALYGF